MPSRYPRLHICDNTLPCFAYVTNDSLFSGCSLDKTTSLFIRKTSAWIILKLGLALRFFLTGSVDGTATTFLALKTGILHQTRQHSTIDVGLKSLNIEIRNLTYLRFDCRGCFFVIF